MTIDKLSTVDAFVVRDLDDAPLSVGVARSAKKILVDGAELMARSITYGLAGFEIKAGGASAGINALPDDTATAVAAFVAEIAPKVAEGSLALDPAKGVPDGAFAPLHATDARAIRRERPTDHEALASGVVAAAAAAATGGLEGKTVAIEGMGDAGPALVAEFVARGATVTTIATAAGAITDAAGIKPDDLAEMWKNHGAGFITADGREVQPVWSATIADVDILCAGSKTGAIDHNNADKVRAGLVVPHGPAPVTARAYAMLSAAGTTYVPDFLSTAGPLLTWFSETTTPSDIETAVGAAVERALASADGPFLGACGEAERFLTTWQSTLPFGRPIA